MALASSLRKTWRAGHGVSSVTFGISKFRVVNRTEKGRGVESQFLKQEKLNILLPLIPYKIQVVFNDTENIFLLRNKLDFD
jgi:hypothetical protein